MSDPQVSKTYLELSDATSGSHKFYEVTIAGREVIVRFGRIGTAGQVKIESHTSHESAVIAAEVRVKEKLTKGYEVAAKGARQMKSIVRRTKPTLDEQLRTLAECGITLSPGIEKEVLFASFEPEEFVKEPYLLLLVALGEENEDDQYEEVHVSANIWHFDTECIEDHGDYVHIADRMKDLAGGALPLEEITDYVDTEKGEAWLAFHLDSQSHRWTLEVDNDWVDVRVFDEFDKLLQSRSEDK